jgi:hypothetical protein
MATFEPVFQALHDAKVRYVVVGRPQDMLDIQHLEAILEARKAGHG